MRRREALSAICSVPAIALAGCVNTATSRADADGRPTTTTDATTEHSDSATTTGLEPRIATVSGFMPEELDFDLQVRVSNHRTRSTPPTLEVELTSTVDQTRTFGRYRPFGYPTAEREDGDEELLIIPENVFAGGDSDYVPEDGSTDQYVPEEPRNGCWTATTDVNVINQLGYEVEFSSGESISNTYHVLNHPDNEDCFPAGRYRATDRTANESGVYHWGFEIVVE